MTQYAEIFTEANKAETPGPIQDISGFSNAETYRHDGKIYFYFPDAETQKDGKIKILNGELMMKGLSVSIGKHEGRVVLEMNEALADKALAELKSGSRKYGGKKDPYERPGF